MEIVRRTHRQTGAPVIPPVDVFTMQLHLPGVRGAAEGGGGAAEGGGGAAEGQGGDGWSEQPLEKIL